MFEVENLKETDLKLLYSFRNIKEEFLDSMKGFITSAIDSEKYYIDELDFYHKTFKHKFETEKYKETVEKLEKK